jgi:hypothetical protein
VGHWETITRDWWETTVRNCTVCGQMMAAQVWVCEDEGHTCNFCSPDCEELYYSYWKRKYGKHAPED